MNQSCFILYGPTASGKSNIANKLAKKLPIEIVNMDSVQVFKGFNIGAAKPDHEILKEIPHHLIDIASVPEHFSVSAFLEHFDIVIRDIKQRGKIPLVVGGTMLYLKAIVDGGLSAMPDIDEQLKFNIHKALDCITQKQKYDLLIMVDSEWAKQIHPNDIQRTTRGLLVYFATKRPISSFNSKPNQYQFHPKLIAINVNDRQWLHQRISKRVDLMLEMGLIEEVVNLIKSHHKYLDHFVFRSIGYKQVIDMIKHGSDCQTFKNELNAATRQFAKRQITWMKRYQADLVVDPTNYSLINIEEWLISHGNYG